MVEDKKNKKSSYAVNCTDNFKTKKQYKKGLVKVKPRGKNAFIFDSRGKRKKPLAIIHFILHDAGYLRPRLRVRVVLTSSLLFSTVLLS